MAIKIASWNVEGRLGWVARRGRGAPQRIVDRLLASDADVIFLPEAYGCNVAEGVDAQILKSGYQLYDVSYGDEGKPGEPSDENPHNRFLSRLPVVQQESLRFGDVRTLQAVHVIDPATERPICILGIHLDDRTESRRLRQVKDIIVYIKKQTTPVVMMGDFNAMYGDTKKARLLRGKLASFGAWLCARYFIGSIIKRVADMAKGTTLSSLHEALELRTLNEKHWSTTTPKMRQVPWLPSVRLLEIDYILVSTELSAKDFAIDADGGSDHRLLSATISIRDALMIAKS